MLDLDVKEIERKLNVIMSLDKENARLAQYILTFNPLLQDAIEDWLNGKEADFEYNGLSIKEIMKRLGVPYHWAFDIMNTYIDNSKDIQEDKRKNLEEWYAEE